MPTSETGASGNTRALREERETSMPDLGSPDIAEDLMKRVGLAIDDWTQANGLESLPKDVLLTQVASILNAMGRELGREGP